ncbi:hypothetical protein ACWXVT_02205 [Mycoplasma sp. 1573]
MDFRKRINEEIEEILHWYGREQKQKEIYSLEVFGEFLESNKELANENNYETLRDFFIYDPLDSQNPASKFLEENQCKWGEWVIDYPRLEKRCKRFIRREQPYWPHIHKYTELLSKGYSKPWKYFYENPDCGLLWELSDKGLQDWKKYILERRKKKLIEGLGLKVDKEDKNKNNTQLMSV